MKVNNKEFKRFWNFVRQRHMVWYNRFILQAPRALWTNNKYLKRYRFTNVYRVLDRGSQWCINNIINVETNPIDTFWKIYVYRMINRIETFEEIGIPDYNDWDSEDYMNALYGAQQKLGAIFSSAYITCQSSRKQDRIHNFLDMAEAMYEQLPELLDYISYHVLYKDFDLETWCKRLSKVYGIGMFTAFQISLDLIYAKMIPDQRWYWADPGPGCRKGLEIIFPNITRDQYQECMIFLRDSQEENLGSEFPYFNDELISLSDIENCLCEFDKYWNMRNNRGKRQRLFSPMS